MLHALGTLGFREAKDLRVGKFFELNLEAADRKKAEARVRQICDKLLINPVIEEYSFELADLEKKDGGHDET